ncbi:hypothetical protein ONZ45_g14396 [Pleurotus djamor]|nr:hypothetical protein ONZ45_g14396 [Pleurotus djamor]
MAPLSSTPSLSSLLNSNLGALFLGDNAAAVFFGITSLQTYIYLMKRSSRDSKTLRLSMFFLWILDCLHFVSIVHNLYHYTVTNFTSILVLFKPIWSLPVSRINRHPDYTEIKTLGPLRQRSTLPASAIYWFEGYSHIGYGNVRGLIIVPPLPKVVIDLDRLILSEPYEPLVSVYHRSARINVRCGRSRFTITTFAEYPKVTVALYIGLSSGVAADFVIAAVLVALLLQSRTESKRTRSLLNTLMVYAINTGLFTTSMCLITFALWPDRLIYIGIYFVLSDLSLNALLATLNARDDLRERAFGNNTTQGAVAFCTSHSAAGAFSGTTASSSSNRDGIPLEPLGLVVHVQKQINVDEPEK